MSEFKHKDEFGARMKMYEAHSNPALLSGLPVCARLDGRSFHSFTKHVKRPFSDTFHEMMVDITRHLVVESCATVGYTQSDEISLVWVERPFFDGNTHKLCSTLAAMASVRLNGLSYVKEDDDIVRETASGLAWHMAPTFDCRAWVVPSLVEAMNAILWRQQDAYRNSIQMAAQHHLSHKACENLNGKELQEKLLAEVAVNWEDYPTWARRGTFVKHVKTRRAFTSEELNALSLKHNAHKNPDLLVERRILQNCDLDLREIKDRVAALFTDDMVE